MSKKETKAPSAETTPPSAETEAANVGTPPAEAGEDRSGFQRNADEVKAAKKARGPKQFTVTHPILMDGKFYDRGDKITLDAKRAAELAHAISAKG